MKNKPIFLLLCMVAVLTSFVFGIQVNASGQQDVSDINRLEIRCGNIPKNGSREDLLVWGSDMNLYAQAFLEDGTEYNKNDFEITWSIRQKGGGTVKAILICDNTDQSKKINMYAPFGYEEELIIEAKLVGKEGIRAEYAIRTSSKSPDFGDDYPNGERYFNFSANLPNGIKKEGDDPVVNENWDEKNGSYSVIMPECTYTVKGLKFDGWMDTATKNVYLPGECLSVAVQDYSGVWRDIYAVWSDINPPTVPKPVKIKSARRVKSSKAKIVWKRIKGSKGYQLEYSINRRFTKKKTVILNSKKNKYVLLHLKKKKPYYVRIRAYTYDKVGNRINGRYSKIGKIKK